jgi:hypothetical protein
MFLQPVLISILCLFFVFVTPYLQSLQSWSFTSSFALLCALLFALLCALLLGVIPCEVLVALFGALAEVALSTLRVLLIELLALLWVSLFLAIF